MIKYIYIFLLCVSSFAHAQDEAADLPNFHEVIPGVLYRGAQPSPKGVQTLASQYHIKVIIDLREEDPGRAKQEQVLAESLGMKLGWFPMNALRKPNDVQINQVEGILATASPSLPIFVHCQHGQDRTGLIIGLYRVLIQRPPETPQEAHDEMVSLGFHTLFKDLEHYFWSRASSKGVLDSAF